MTAPEVRLSEMRVGLDARTIRVGMHGVGTYVYRLVEYLTQQQVHCVLFVDPNVELPQFSRPDTLTIQAVHSTNHVGVARYLDERLMLPGLMKKHRLSLYHATDSHGLPFHSPVPTVLTVHDVIPLMLDEYLNRWTKLVYRASLVQSIQSANRVITISQFSKHEIVRHTAVDPKKIAVIYNGYTAVPGTYTAEWQAFQRTHGIQGPVVAYVGGLGPRKNIERLLKAFSIVRARHPELSLILTGRKKETIQKSIQTYVRLIAALHLEKSVVFTDYLEEASLNALRTHAQLAVYPSLSEGFGLPVIEAMALGVPIVASNVSAIPEVAGDAAVLVSPLSEKDIATGMLQVLEDAPLRDQLIAKGKARAKDFSWEAMGSSTLDVYRQVLGAA